jgi:hypothetical protein
MCIGGSNKATRQAERAEAERTRGVEQGTAAVNQAFTQRQPQYDQLPRHAPRTFPHGRRAPEGRR